MQKKLTVLFAFAFFVLVGGWAVTPVQADPPNIDDGCHGSHKACGPVEEDSGPDKKLPLKAKLDDGNTDNLQSDSSLEYVHNEGHVQLFAGGSRPSGILLNVRNSGKNPRELFIDVSCTDVGGVDPNCGMLMKDDFPTGNEVNGDILVTGAGATFRVIPYRAEVCPFDDCPNVFTMEPSTPEVARPELMSFRIFFDGGPVIEVASTVGPSTGSTGADSGQCLSLLGDDQLADFLKDNDCVINPSLCNVTVKAFDNIVDDDGENDEWRIDANGVKALICGRGPTSDDNVVIGQTTLTFRFDAEKK